LAISNIAADEFNPRLSRGTAGERGGDIVVVTVDLIAGAGSRDVHRYRKRSSRRDNHRTGSGTVIREDE